ncbi:hypothetical protein N7494_001042 [Penicillium frequentans]|uniref:Fungal STAND N-terminal Goodbye domain-containing protein n=1 Tax=Penicillium frequentans TaxID=3151616 RepID=A0AAD6D9A0_9EURO|nr:hypothetical protein N7494_001042 [Penicillium glabrum]
MDDKSRQHATTELKTIRLLLIETCDQFDSITNRRLESRRYEETQSFDELKERISSGDESESKTKQRLLTIVSTVQTLIGPVKTATDIAFSPASACLSALSFLLEIPSKAHSIHESIRAVIDEVEPRFTELKVYDEMSRDINPILMISVCNVLMAFIILCAQCVKHLESGKTSRYFKEGTWILSNKNPIKDGLDRLKELSDQKEHVQSMIMLKKLLESSGKIEKMGGQLDGISDFTSKRSDELVRQENLRQIKKHLRVNSDDEVLMGYRVDEETSHIVKDKKCLFLESEIYKIWAFNKEQDVKPLILISGGPGTGKSVLSASMFLDVKDKEPFVAYYSFPPMPKNRKDHQQPLEDCVRATGLQLAEQSPDYRRRLLHLLTSTREGRVDGTDYKGLLKTLDVWQAPDKMICYLFLDGLNNLAESEFKELMNDLTTKQIPSKGKKLTRNHPLYTVKMEDLNDRVIGDYIDKFLKQKDLLQEDFLDFAALRTSIHDTVAKTAGGSFHKVQKRLDKIENLVQSDSRDELGRFLDALHQGGSELAESELRDLERTLDSKEIAELNELVIWCEYNMSRDVILGIEQLEAFLFIRSNSQPLRSLRKRIGDRFSLILEERDDGVRLREEMKKWVILKQDGERKPAISATITVENTSIQVAQRFFWDLANHSVMDRFNFDANQVDMSKPSRHRIQATKLNAHLVIVKRTFEFLRKAPDSLSRPIGGILLRDLPAHLAVLQERPQLEKLVDNDRRTIGENVQELLLSPMSLERHWDVLQNTRWHTDQKAKQAFWKWLSDDAAIKHPIIRDKIKELRSDPKPDQKLFEPLARLAGYKWLQDRSPDSTTGSFEWIKSFLDMDEQIEHVSQNTQLGSEQDEDEYEEDDDRSEDKDSTEDDNSTQDSNSTKDGEEGDDVTKAEKWCEKALGPSRLRERDVWVQRLAETYAYAHSRKKAFNKYQETSELLESMGDIDRDRHGKVLVCLASLARKKDQALEFLKKALDLSASNISARYELIKAFFLRDRKQELEERIHEVLKLRVVSGPMRHLGLVMQMAIEDDDYDDDAQKMHLLFIISSTCYSSAENFNYLLEDMQIAIDNAKAQNQDKLCATLLLHKGITLACYSEKPCHTDQAIKAWEECAETILAKIKHQSTGAILLEQVGRQLSLYYFTQGSKFLKEPEKTEFYSKKLEEVYQNQKGVIHGMSAAKTYLAADLVRKGKKSAAAELFRENVKEAFGLLSDDTTGNDNRGFTLLFQIFLYIGDQVNSHVAFSLLARRALDTDILKEWLQSDVETTTPEAIELCESLQEDCTEMTSVYSKIEHVADFLESKMESMQETSHTDDDAAKRKSYEALFESMSRYEDAFDDANNDYVCDECDYALDTSRSMYACTFCYNIGLCDSCLQRFKNEEFKTPLCRVDHEWMQIPPWNAKTHVRAYRRKVCMDATVANDGTLQGGREVPLVEWLNSLKVKWDPQGVWKFQ